MAVNAVAAMSASLEALKPYKFDRYAPGDSDVSFDIHYCGICHTVSLCVSCCHFHPSALLPQKLRGVSMCLLDIFVHQVFHTGLSCPVQDHATLRADVQMTNAASLLSRTFTLSRTYWAFVSSHSYLAMSL